MPQWCEDFSALSLAEVLETQEQNRSWSKELRRKSLELVNLRLAKGISQADYQVHRELTQEEAQECRRRAEILQAQVLRRRLNRTAS